MIIGLIGAMANEIAIIKKTIFDRKKILIGKCVIYKGTFLKTLKIVIVQSGIGKTSSAIGATILLSFFKPDLVINFGISGSLQSLTKKGDIIIANKVLYHDVNLVKLGYFLGQIPDNPHLFLINKNILFLVKNFMKKYQIKFQEGLMTSGDQFIYNEDMVSKILKNFPEAISVDMESSTVAHVCYHFSVPFLVIRSISDIAIKNNLTSFEDDMYIGIKNVSSVIYKLLKDIEKNQSVYSRLKE
ncbi:5'-methylthioadenosine/adenosylhomocysteine nucleosidase [Candidatus Tachikawaea gelatinosa]|uniref:adenosylhomocysteine nucleosidase n=1 Tax=Candidatus Tachikawaea gelatinosa TaxID=1410383 RepID=A0A090ARI1_9ENTR|nr:5'-methylthioadenosine/adenosylhomocysteine nucleosidase [Candidatus Tachikawaea gelatinosa]BAP58390.1 5'-methylthioadenosine/S-adenosylhomocysteine nucleosidase [Candidatus Tachikawaea gelatinosa]